jgi:hypothetical protein
MTVNGLGTNGLRGVARARSGVSRRAGSGGFSVQAEPASVLSPSTAVPGSSLLGLQEAQQDTVGDREARRHADQLLDLLTDMQRSLLEGPDAGAAFERLGRLARQAPLAADPRLAGVQQAVLLRVAVEQARNGLRLLRDT